MGSGGWLDVSLLVLICFFAFGSVFLLMFLMETRTHTHMCCFNKILLLLPCESEGKKKGMFDFPTSRYFTGIFEWATRTDMTRISLWQTLAVTPKKATAEMQREALMSGKPRSIWSFFISTGWLPRDF